MDLNGKDISKRLLTAGFLLAVFVHVCHAQNRWQTSDMPVSGKDSLTVSRQVSSEKRVSPERPVSSEKMQGKRDWATWRPEPKRALWLAIVLPGAGQIYNRKYWKLPLVYGGFVGCIYAMQWNNTMYRDYSQAYQDIMDNDPTTQSYNQFLHLGTRITSANMAQYQSIFKRRKDRYRRWRDLSFFCHLAVYALSIVDAYVDASVSEFDISDDLSLRLEPAVITSQKARSPLHASALGIHCSLQF